MPSANFMVERNAYLRMIDGIVYGEDPRQGYVENNVFYHPELKFQFPTPSGWTMQNMATQVQFTPADGKALLLMDIAPEKDLKAAADATITKDSLKVVEGPKMVSVNNLSAASILADLSGSNSNESIRIQIYLIQYNNMIYRFYGMSYLNEFEGYKGLFLNTMQHFKVLTDPSKIEVSPERIRIREVVQNGTLSDALRAFNVPEKRWNELAIVNGMELSTAVTQGMLLKTLVK